MVVSLFFSTDASDFLLLLRIYACFTAAALITGYPLIGALFATIGTFGVRDDEYQASSRNDGEVVSNWLLLNTSSIVASVASWMLISFSKMQGDHNKAYRIFFFGYVIQKVWALGMAYVLYQDFVISFDFNGTNEKVTQSAKSSTLAMGRPSANASRREFLMKRKSSLAVVLYEIRVRVMMGRNLVPMDHEFKLFGKMTTSDPYVVVALGPNIVGKTDYVSKTLNPVWPNKVFRMTVLPKSIEVYKQIECQIYDYDYKASDDPMGTVYVPIPEQYNTKVARWYKVHKGVGETYCENATGELLVEIEVIAN